MRGQHIGTRTLEQHVDLAAAIGRQLAEQVVGDALRLLGALPQDVLQQQQVVLAHYVAAVRVRRDLRSDMSQISIICNPRLVRNQLWAAPSKSMQCRSEGEQYVR